MRISFWVSLLIVATGLSAPAQGPVPLASGKLLTSAASGDRTVFSIPKPAGGKFKLSVSRDTTVAKGARPVSVKLVAEIPNSILIVSDVYSSISGGLGYCQAGKETFLRVISISGKLPVETFRVNLESCRENIELASPGVNWRAQSRTLEIHWLSAPGSVGKSEDRAVIIGPEGKPV